MPRRQSRSKENPILSLKIGCVVVCLFLKARSSGKFAESLKIENGGLGQGECQNCGRALTCTEAGARAHPVKCSPTNGH